MKYNGVQIENLTVIDNGYMYPKVKIAAPKNIVCRVVDEEKKSYDHPINVSIDIDDQGIILTAPRVAVDMMRYDSDSARAMAIAIISTVYLINAISNDYQSALIRYMDHIANDLRRYGTVDD